MAGPKKRRLGGQEAGWLSAARNVADATAGAAITASDVTVYDPPLRLLYITSAGNLSMVLDGDDEAVANQRTTLPVTAGQILDKFAIRQIRAATTATGILGFR